MNVVTGVISGIYSTGAIVEFRRRWYTFIEADGDISRNVLKDRWGSITDMNGLARSGNIRVTTEILRIPAANEGEIAHATGAHMIIVNTILFHGFPYDIITFIRPCGIQISWIYWTFTFNGVFRYLQNGNGDIGWPIRRSWWCGVYDTDSL